MENGPFIIDVLPIKMVIFNSYVSLPEGIPNIWKNDKCFTSIPLPLGEASPGHLPVRRQRSAPTAAATLGSALPRALPELRGGATARLRWKGPRSRGSS